MFIRLNWITDAQGKKVRNADQKNNSDRSLIITEFCVGLLRLAKALRSKRDKNEMLSESLAKFMKKRIIPREQNSSTSNCSAQRFASRASLKF